jgi:hypothetical protein
MGTGFLKTPTYNGLNKKRCRLPITGVFVWLTLFTTCLSFGQQPFARWTFTALTLDNGMVRRVIQLPASSGNLLTTSFRLFKLSLTILKKLVLNLALSSTIKCMQATEIGRW